MGKTRSGKVVIQHISINGCNLQLESLLTRSSMFTYVHATIVYSLRRLPTL